MAKMRDLYHTCGRKLRIYENPQRAVCPKHGIVTSPKEMLIPDPGVDVDTRFFIGRKKRKKK